MFFSFLHIKPRLVNLSSHARLQSSLIVLVAFLLCTCICSNLAMCRLKYELQTCRPAQQGQLQMRPDQLFLQSMSISNSSLSLLTIICSIIIFARLEAFLSCLYGLTRLWQITSRYSSSIETLRVKPTPQCGIWRWSTYVLVPGPLTHFAQVFSGIRYGGT